MGAAKKLTSPIQILSLAQIEVDPELQSRVAMSVGDQREFSEAMLRGDEFPPVVVFFDGSRYWLADGFHRHGAAKAIGAKGIRAEVRGGTRRDAVLFSAGANQKFSIPRTTEDIRKSIWMILSDEEGFSWSLGRLAKHVGTTAKTVQRHRVAHAERYGVSLPKEVVTIQGERCDATGMKAPAVLPRLRKKVKDGKVEYYGKVGGKSRYLGRDYDAAATKLVERRRQYALTRPASPPAGIGRKLPEWFAGKGVGMEGLNWMNGVGGQVCRGYVLTWVEHNSKFPEAIGRAAMLRIHCGGDIKPVILFRGDLNQAFAEAVASLGIAIHTPEEFLELIRAEESR